ncbi:hypothetical protein [Kitasatospora sp. NPDC047058]|uniref:hypothetical protein n=1 Tax=Kitasatospora sp. NPDC047058 TaxID=3155620 RepID=UPI0033E53ABA
MHADWDNAHTDFQAPGNRPSAAGLAESESDWRRQLAEAPNGHLLRDNAMLRALASGAPIHLLHLTRSLDAVRRSEQLLASTGCLVGALYCSPLTLSAGGALRPHNLGAHMLESRTTLESRSNSTPLVIEVTPSGPAPAKGLDYLRLGSIHMRTHLAFRHVLTSEEDDQVTRSVVDRVRAAAPFLDTLLRTASGAATANEAFLNDLAATVPVLPYLGYVYFETVAEYLMLHSTSPATRACAERGEMNNRLYKDLAFAAVEGMGVLFDVGRFHPDHARLLGLVGRIEASLTPGVAGYVRRRMSHLFAATALATDQDATAITFHGADLDMLTRAAPSLLGQLLFRDVRLLDRYPQLYHCFEQAKALEAWAYWNSQGIGTPFNGTCPKGEIGINPAYPNARFTVWTARSCERGLVHPVDELVAVPAPRLVPWLVAPLRDRTEEQQWLNRRPVPASGRRSHGG